MERGGSGMGPMPAAPPPSDARMKMAMHASFFWGDRVLVLFPGWPGDRGVGMYLLCLLVVFALALLTEALSAASRRPSPGPGLSNAMVATGIHAAKMGMAYLVMLAVMSFNVGVLIAAILGHAIGFLLATSRATRLPAPPHSSKP